MIKIMKYMRKKEWALVGVSLLFIVAQVFLDLQLPSYMSQITMLVQTEGSTISQILSAGGMMLLCALGSMAMAIAVGFFAARIATTFGARLRELTFKKTLSFSMEETGKFSVSSLITRSTNDVTQIQTFVVMGLQALIKAPIMAVWAIAKIAGKQWQWTMTTAVAVLFMMIIIGIVIAFAMPKFKIVQKQTDRLNLVTRENLTGIRVVRAYNAEDYQEEKFEEANENLTKTNLFTSRITALMQPSMSLIMSGLSLAIYWIGAYLIAESAGMQDKMLLFSDMVVFSSYAMQVVMAFMMLTMIFILYPRASVSAERINEVLDTKMSIVDGTITDSPKDKTGEVEFRNVSFKYPDAEESSDYVLKDINFTVHKGETLAIIGSTGSGKSSLINLIPRFFDVTEGEVLVDGVDVRDYNMKALRNKLGYVSQKTVMFRGTVEDNVSYGDNGRSSPNAEEIERAVEIAQGTEFVENLEEGYNAPVAQGGSNFSGGQKQRLSIARAIAREPEIMIFDDSFSALDYKTDRALRAALEKENKGTSNIIVAQRIGTIKDADKIIVLDEGRIAGMGKHDDLMENCEVYREIAYSQLSKEELKVG